MKRTGKRRTGHLFAPFEVAGAGDGLTATLHGHEAGNGGYSQGEPYGGTAPVLDPTILRDRLGAGAQGRGREGAEGSDVDYPLAAGTGDLQTRKEIEVFLRRMDTAGG